MPRPVFAVILEEPNPAVMERLKKLYRKDALVINDASALVCADALAEDVAVGTGVKGGDDPAGGIVFKLNRAYAGFTHRSVWEWLERAEAEGLK